MKSIILTAVFTALGLLCYGQATNLSSDLDFLPAYQRNHPIYHEADKLDLRQDSFINVHTAIRSFSPKTIQQLSGLEQNQNSDPLVENDRKGFLGTFYKNPDRLYELNTDAFKFGVNLVANFKLGYESKAEKTIFQNTRGIEFYGNLDDKLFFYSTYHENQSNLLNYQQPFIDTIKSYRGYGNYKDYQSSVIDRLNGYDYGYAEAFLAYNLSKHSSLTLGHGNHMIGNGVRSLLLGDDGPNYFYLKLQVQVWKLHYQCIWAELATLPARLTPNNTLLPKKYMANHYFSFKPRQNLEIGLFESVVFSRENNFELQYLNPVIFYRTIEHQLDSPDNVLLGLNLKWNLYQRVSLYSQVILDEFNLNQLTSGNQWWGNKYGYQLGLKYFDMAGITNLDVQVELNTVRPYTYTHGQASPLTPAYSVANYSHYGQPLAHPLGANFREILTKLSYHPTDKLTLTLHYIHTTTGRNTNQNFGADILQPSDTRISEFGIAQNQGALSTISMIDFVAAYKLTNNLFVDLQLMQREDSNAELQDYSTTYIGLGVRYNYYGRRIDY